MTKLVQTLLAQHRAIEGKVKVLQQAVEAGDAQRAEAALTQFKSALLTHLAIEDQELYPGLERLGKQLEDARLVALGATFSSSMAGISRGLGNLLARYERRFELATFARDWPTIRTSLASRIQSEESALYRLYEDAEARAAKKAG